MMISKLFPIIWQAQSRESKDNILAYLQDINEIKETPIFYMGLLHGYITNDIYFEQSADSYRRLPIYRNNIARTPTGLIVSGLFAPTVGRWDDNDYACLFFNQTPHEGEIFLKPLTLLKRRSLSVVNQLKITYIMDLEVDFINNLKEPG